MLGTPVFPEALRWRLRDSQRDPDDLVAQSLWRKFCVCSGCYGWGKTASIRGPSVDQNTLYGGWPMTGSRIRIPPGVVIAVERDWACPGSRKMNSMVSKMLLYRSTSGPFSRVSSCAPRKETRVVAC